MRLLIINPFQKFYSSSKPFYQVSEREKFMSNLAKHNIVALLTKQNLSLCTLKRLMRCVIVCTTLLVVNYTNYATSIYYWPKATNTECIKKT